MKKVILAFVLTATILSACHSDYNLPGGIDGGNEYANKESFVRSDGTQPQPERHETQADDIGQNEAEVVENSAEIKAAVSKNCNYVYHMLSVSGCGYDNEYGRKYRPLHPEADLQTLKNYEQLLTVVGGEHQGNLYFPCVAIPASLDDDVSVSAYFKALADLFSTGEVEKNFNANQEIYLQALSSYTPYVNIESFRWFYVDNKAMEKEIIEIADVMERNEEIYAGKVWETSLKELTVIAEELNQEFAKTDYVGKWQAALNTQYKHDVFMAVICNSIENGVHAIDISGTKDVFYHDGDTASTVNIISYEFGIYLLKDALTGTAAFQSLSTYGLTEGLAEYFNTMIAGVSNRKWNNEYVDFYKQLKEREPEITAKEMFLRAVEQYQVSLVLSRNEKYGKEFLKNF